MCDKSEEKKILQDVLKELKQANVQINKLNEENEINKKGREKLNSEIEELKQANFNQFMKLTKEIAEIKEINENTVNTARKEIKELKETKEENQNLVENLRREVEELKQEVHEYKKKYENQIEDKHNITNQPPPPVFRFTEDLLISGLEKFIENCNSDIPYMSYEEWYKNIFGRLLVNKLFLYEKYLFMKVKCEKRYNKIFWYTKIESNNNSKWIINVVRETVYTFTYDDNWKDQHIKYSILLHPKEINKTLELHNTVHYTNYNRFNTCLLYTSPSPRDS